MTTNTLSQEHTTLSPEHPFRQYYRVTAIGSDYRRWHGMLSDLHVEVIGPNNFEFRGWVSNLVRAARVELRLNECDLVTSYEEVTGQ